MSTSHTPYPSKFLSRIIVNIVDEKKFVLANQFLQKINLKLMNVNHLEMTPTNTGNTDNLLTITNFIDARGLPCPQPLLKVKVALRSINEGEFVYLIATDSNSQADIQAYAKHANITLYLEKSCIVNNDSNVNNDENNELWHFLLSR